MYEKRRGEIRDLVYILQKRGEKASEAKTNRHPHALKLRMYVENYNHYR